MKFRHLVLCTAALAIIFTDFAPGSSALAASSDESGYSKIHPSWSRSFESQVRWQRVTPLGDLLVNTAESLYGVDPLTGEIRWQHPGIGRFNGKSFEMIPDTPFAVISTKKEPSRVVIVDSMDGRIIFDSAKAGIKNVMSRHLLPGRQGILIAGVPNGGTLAGLSMFDATTGEQKWLNENIFKTKRTAMKIASMFLDRSKESKRFNNEAFEINEGAFLFASDLGLFNINSNTGEIIWKVTNYAGADPRIFFSQQKPDMMVVGSKFRNNMGGANETVTALYSAYRISDGQQLWKEPISMNGEVNKVIFHDRGLILSPLTSARAYIKLIDYSTGKSLWGKKGRGIKATGGIVDHVVSGNMMLLTTGFDNAWTNKGTEYYLNVLDMAAGAFRYEKAYKVKGRILKAELLPTGILFVTTSEVSFLDPITGKARSKEKIESEDSIIAAEHGDKIFVFSTRQKSLYLVDKSTSTISKMSDRPVKFEGDEVPFSMEIGEDGITLVSSQNIAVFQMDGKLKFHRYHPAPRHSGFMRALLIANSIRAGMASAASGMMGGAFATAAAKQEPGSAGNTLGAGMAQGYGEMAVGLGGVSRKFADAARERFKKSRNAVDFVFMMVQLKGSYGLAQVSKKSGEIVKVMDMKKDKSPSYQVDSIANVIFYRIQTNEISGFKL